jgi:chaperonin GroEL (HSP60 family)
MSATPELAGTPVLILKEGSTREKGRGAQHANIMAARIIAETVKTTLGPRGMDKMLIDSLGDITITNDGAAILDEIDVEHPSAKMMVEVAKELRDYATKVGGREQLAIEAFADSMEIVPKALAENAGLEPIDIIVALRSAHEKPKGHVMGVDIFTGKIVDTLESGVIEPVKVKEQAMKSATEATSMILRIDDVIASTKPKGEGMPGGPKEEEEEF